MGDFSGNTRDVTAVRKPHECEQCRRKIEIGAPAKYAFGVWEGYSYSVYTHPECSAAAHEYSVLNDLWGEEYPWFRDMDDSEHGHHAWLLANHPIVAERLNIEAEETP